ncbi:MAG: ABC transporter permease, partial [Pseudomonadota bacterium]|nr:ABC transporter permease [Pseudomonadota bacterium]
MFHWVILSTDFLLYALLLALIIFIIWVRRNEDLRAPWRQVGRRRLAMVALVVLSCFILVGVLDSVHLRFALHKNASGQVHYSGEVYSVLDLIMGPVGERYEKTYSAPFASRAYSKAIMPSASGQLTMAYPPLLYGGAEPAEVTLLSVGLALAVAIAGWLIFTFSLVAWQAKQSQISLRERWRMILQNKANLAWRELFFTLLVMMIIISVCAACADKYHILGTDKVGKDVFFAAVKSIRTGLVIGTVTTLVMLPFAMFLGTAAGFFGGWVDDVIQYVYTTLSSIPGVLLISATVLTLQVYIANHPNLFPTIIEQADARLLALCIILGVTSWTSLCRLLRAETLKVREMDYVRMATALGVQRLMIIFRHVLPNVLHIVLITVVLDFSSLVLAEAVLSYVGVGV